MEYKSKNNGERNELIIKICLIKLRDTKVSINLNSKDTKIESVGFESEYNKLSNSIDIKELSNYSDSQLENIAVDLGIKKSPTKSKSDVYINGVGISLKSLEHAPPAIVNHTPRTGFEVACKISGVNIEILDKMIDKYWDLRLSGKIKEDVINHDDLSPFRNSKDQLKLLLNYFLFDGTGQGLSNNKAEVILDYQSPIDSNTWNTYNRDNVIDKIWDKLVFSLRSKGMPEKYPNIEINKYKSISKWTRYFQEKEKGSLHIRVK